MKHRNFIKNSIMVLLPISLGLGVLLGVSKPSKTKETEAYTVNTVPKNINLNDCTDTEIRNYYINGGLNTSTLSNASQRSGTNLLKNLKPILKNGQKYFSYGGSATTAVWQAYEIVDRDWSKSPASAISGYNSSTNVITNYSYGTSNSNPGSNPYIHALYVNRNVTNQTRAWGNHDQNQWGINQEHIWAKSCGFSNDGSTYAVGARGDLMHLWAGNGRVNGVQHSNYYYGYVDPNRSPDDAGSYASTLSGNKKGKSKTLGGNNTVFEPQDSDKGDIARAIFYMAARYNYYSGSDTDGINVSNPNLQLINALDWNGGSGYDSSTTKVGTMGILQDLLEWNRLDPPDAWEIHRNNLLYRNFTNNRNPFIDFPEWAEYVWGKSTDGSYSSTSTGSANPSSDTINNFSSGGSATVSSVTVSPSSVTLNLQGTTSTQLAATVVGTNNPSQAVEWSSSNANVATVNTSGVVTAVGTGSVTITATSVADSTKKGTCTVSVQNTTVAVSSVSLNKNATTLYVGGNETLVETILPSNATNKEVSWTSSNSSVCTVSNGVIHARDEGTATITVTTDDGDKTASCAVTVEAAPSSITASTTIENYATANSWANETIYETLTLDSNVTLVSDTTQTRSNTGKYYSSSKEWRFYQSEGASITVELSDEYELDSVTFTFTNNNSGKLLDSSSNAITSGTATSLSGNSATFTISKSGTGTNGQIKFTGISVTYHLKAKVLESISVDASKAKTNYYVNDTFSSDNLVVTAHYTDETDAEVEGYSVTTPNMSSPGTKTVTVTYEENDVEKSDTYDITVSSSSGSHSDRIVCNVNSSYFEIGSSYFTGTTSSASVSNAGYTISWTKETSSYDVNLTNNQIRVYGNQKFLFTPASGYTITSVVLTAGSNDYASKIGGSGLNNCTNTIDGSVVTLTPTNGAQAFYFKNTYVSYINYLVVNYEASSSSEPSLDWIKPTINVYSGATLTALDTDAWEVTYDDGSGNETRPTLSDLTLKLGVETLSIPHTWAAEDDGLELHVEYAGISTSSSTVKVTQTINSVMQPTEVSHLSTLTFTAACGGSGTADDGKSWTVTSDADESQYDSTKGVHYGTGKLAVEYVQLVSNSFTEGRITNVVVNASGASGVSGSVSVTVGGNAFGTTQSFNSTASDKTFEGSASAGSVVVRIYKASSSAGAIYCKSISVTYKTEGAPSNIANSTSHINAQRVAVKYAKAFNAAMAETAYCTTGLDAAWTTCSSAYNTFKSEAAALGTNEETYAKNLIKYATVQYSNDSGEACIERMMKTYEICVNQHGKSEFMSDLITVGSNQVSPILINLSQNKSIGFIIIISAIGVGVIGGYFFMKSRRKEDF